MAKKILIMGVALIICIGIFAGCGDGGKIDVGGKIKMDLMRSSVTRIMLDKDTFYREDEVEIKVGFGFASDSIRQYYLTIGRVVILKMVAKDFIITDEEGIETEDLYKKYFEEYSDSKFVCDEKSRRYIPNYYETFRLKLSDDIENVSGLISVQAGPYYIEDNINGEPEAIYFAANSNKIAFSAKSVADAQSKL